MRNAFTIQLERVIMIVKAEYKEVQFSSLPEFPQKENSPKAFTCPLGKLRVKSTSLTAKSTSPGLSDTNFFVPCKGNLELLEFFFLQHPVIAVIGRRSGLMANYFAVLQFAPSRGTALWSWAGNFTSHWPLLTQVYKWVPANLLLGITLRWTSIPHRG